MSNPTELPDLDQIAKLLYVALNNVYQGGGCSPSERDAVVDALKEYNRYRSLPARRAKPKGEAPQAEPVAWMLDFGDGRVVTADRKEMEAWVTQHDNPYTPIPLGPITAPAAQHADSGAPASGDVRQQFEAWAEDAGYPTRRGFGNANDYGFVETRRMWESWRAALAAQSQGAQPLPTARAGDPDVDAAHWAEVFYRNAETFTVRDLGIVRAAWKEATRRAAQQAAAPEDIDLRKDEAARLRRVVRAMGIDHQVPGNDARLRDCLFSVLGIIAGKLESAPGTPEAPILPQQSDMDAYANSGYHRFMTFDAFKAFRADCAARAAQLDGGHAP